MAKNTKFISEGGSSNIPPLFDGDNYYYRKDKMELFLRSQDNNMWHVVEVAEYVPLAKDSTNPKPQAEWSTQEADREEETIEQMYGRFISIINELNSLGKTYTTHERIRKILRCLPKIWRPIVTAITVAKDLTKVSVEDLIGSLKAHESILQEDKPKKKMIALETQSRECSQKNETLCEDEESLQEDDEEELAFLSRRIQRLMTRRNQLKKNFQPKRNGTKPEVDMSKIQCYGCNQFCHYENDCPKNKQKKLFFKKKSMMATWDDLEEAQSEYEEQEANVCLMTHSNLEEKISDKNFETNIQGPKKLMLKTYDKIMSTPMHPSTSLDKDEKGKNVSEKEYRGMIGSLIYLTASRPDIVFAVGLCARFQTSPKESHLIAVKRIFRYLVGTPDVGLWYKKGSHFDLQAYCDADYAGDKIERKSTSGACQFLGEALVSWYCRKQNTIALSTTEAEYVVASNCCSQVIWIKNQLEDFSLRSTQMARTKNAGGRKVPRTKNPSVSSSPPRSPSPPKPLTPKSSSSSSSYETASESHKSVLERETTPEIQSTPITTNMQTTVENPPNSPTTVFQTSPSKSPENSPIHLTQNQPQSPSHVESPQQSQDPTNEEDSPSTTATIPSPKDSPPVLVKIKKSKSFDSSKIRRSSRIMSGAGKKPVVDTTIHVLDQSDSKTDLLEKEIDDFELEPVTSIKSEPVKDKKTSTPKKKEVETAVKAPRTKKKINLKKSKEKLLPSPLIQPEDEEIFDKYWKTKPVAVSRMYNFAELSLGGVDLLFPEKDLITSNIKDVELVVDPYVIGSLIGIKSEGLEVYGNDWYDQVKINKEDLKKKMFTKEGAKKNAPPSSMLKTEYKLLHNMCQHSFFSRTGSKDKKEVESPVADVGVKRKREVFEKSNLNVLADASGDRLENVLQTDGNTQISGDANPTTESEKLATTAATTLKGFKPMPVPPNTMFSPLMTSSQGSLSSFCTSEFIRNILTSDTPEISTMPIPNPTDSTLPSIPSLFATFDSFCSSVNAANAGTKQLVFEGNVNFDFPGPARPTKRSRIETDMEQMRKDLDNVIKGMNVQHSMMDHLILESKTLRTWFTSVVCLQLHLPPPPEIETPQFDPFPAQNDKSNDDESPTTSPAPDGAQE
ncbi:hypothetical protein TSUD_412770 [Trifolium subterraneum]|uniref:CCHC-type domain-containing protein n=1 Tax=Trifolium subterraneum TaxID=3900 RepID=A0A2Z6PIQ8_TRISU|nr:hypothetical protein TSUD_412770 [Trifolium subterraneum]